MTSPANSQPRATRVELLSLAALFVVFVGSRLLLKRVALGSPAAIGLALLPLPGFAWAYYASFRQALSGDEMQRRVGLEGLAIGFGLTVALVLFLGLLENGVPAGAMWVDFSDVASYSLAFALFGYWWAHRRYE